SAFSEIASHLVFLHQGIEPLGECVDHAPLALVHGGQVKAQVAHVDAMRPEAVLYCRIELARLEQCLTGDAPYPEAGPPELRFLLDNGDVHPKLGCTKRRNIPPRSPPDHD